MLDNQAFGWLKTAITLGGSENHTAIESCTDVAYLVKGVSSDFGAIQSADTSVTAAMDEASTDNHAENNTAPTTPSISTHQQDISTRLNRIKTLLYEERSASSAAYASRGNTPNYNWIPTTATSVFKSFTSTHLICELIQHITALPFEARKSIAAIFNYMTVCGMDGADAAQFQSVSAAFGGYVLDKADLILDALVKVHIDAASVDVTLLCGSMLRSCLRDVQLYQYILTDPQCDKLVYPFLDACVHDPNFDVSSDALETVRVMLTGCASSDCSGNNVETKPQEEQYKQTMESIASEFLNRKYEEIIDLRVNKCLGSQSNYITRRMTLQLLSAILLNRSNYNVMIRYISSSKNLVIILCLLRDPSPHITLDAFQVFKIFVANPSKPTEVMKILYDNKVKLIKYLEGLHKAREKSDEQFRDEKGLVIGTLKDLELAER